jgi:hypothetical protein
VAEVAPALAKAGVQEAWKVVEYYGRRAEELGYKALEQRYAGLAKMAPRDRSAAD